MSRDFATPKGIGKYINEEVIPSVKKTFETHGTVASFGVAFTRLQNRKKLAKQEAVVVGGYQDEDVLIAALRKIAWNDGAAGTIIARRQEVETMAGRSFDAIVIQLEHEKFGDCVWVAKTSDADLKFEASKLPHEQLNVERTRLLPRRWTN